MNIGAFSSRILIFIILFLFSKQLLACPDIDVSKEVDDDAIIVDYNVKAKQCGKVKILHVGDSNVDDFTDRSGRGAWPRRLKKRFAGVVSDNQGIWGITANQYLRKLKSGQIKNKKPDICIVGPLGINESIKSHGNPSLAHRDVRRIAKFLKKRFGCFVAVTTVLPILVNQHQSFQQILNNKIRTISSRKYPILDFELSNKHLPDAIHPSAKGYTIMADQAENFIKNTLYDLMKEKRPDTDGDGLSDLYEIKQSKTDPNLYDTDGDGISDGNE